MFYKYIYIKIRLFNSIENCFDKLINKYFNQNLKYKNYSIVEDIEMLASLSYNP